MEEVVAVDASVLGVAFVLETAVDMCVGEYNYMSNVLAFEQSGHVVCVGLPVVAGHIDPGEFSNISYFRDLE